MNQNFEKDKTVDIDRQDASEHPGRAFALGIQEKMGKTLCPSGMEYIGTATVHIYKKPMGPLDDEDWKNTAFMSVMHGFENIPEAITDAAFKTLRGELMMQYGREAPKWRKT